jgi:PAS domain S-box-containing protein
MKDNDKTKEQLINELTVLRKRIIELEMLESQSSGSEENSDFKSQLLDAVMDSIFLHDFAGNIIYVNEIAYLSRGYTKDELIKLNLHHLDVPEYAKLIEPRIEGLMEKGKDIFESAHFRKDRSIMPVEIHARIIELNGKKFILSVVRDITDLKHAEVELRDIEELYSVLVENMNDGLLVINSDAKFVYVNRKLSDMLAYPYDELLHCKMEDFLDLTNQNILYKQLSKRRKGERGVYELEWIRKDGIKISTLVASTPLIEDDDKFKGSYAVITDITQRKKAEEALQKLKDELEIRVKERTYALKIARDKLEKELDVRKQTEEELKKEKDKVQMYIDIAGVILLVIEADQSVSLINKKGCEILGYLEEEITGKNWFKSFIPEKERYEVIKAFQKLMAGEIGPAEYVENSVLTREGKKRIIAWNNTVLTEEDGKIIGTLSSGEDITERKRVEAALKSSEKRYRTIIESSQSGIISIDSKAKVRYINQQMAQMLGYNIPEVIGRQVFDFMDHKGQKKLRNHLKRRKQGIRESYELQLIRKDGSDFWALISANPLFNLKSEYIGSVGVIINISARKGVEKALMGAVVEKENDLRLIMGSLIEAIDQLREKEYHDLLNQQSKLT